MGHVLLLASVIAINASPGLGEIGAFYFESLNQSQVWINLQPRNLEPGPDLRLNVTVFFPGRTLSSAPSTVEIRVDDNCLMFPTRVRVRELSVIHDGLEIRAGAGGVPIVFSSTCGDELSGASVMTMRTPFAALREISTARHVEIRAFGFRAGLTPADIRALASFVAALADGVRLK